MGFFSRFRGEQGKSAQNNALFSETLGTMVPQNFQIDFYEQAKSNNDLITYHYPPAQFEHGRWYNNTFWGNILPPATVGIPGVGIKTFLAQTSPEIFPNRMNQLTHGNYPYGMTILQSYNIANNNGLLANIAAKYGVAYGMASTHGTGVPF